jgi:hypothetical protein
LSLITKGNWNGAIILIRKQDKAGIFLVPVMSPCLWDSLLLFSEQKANWNWSCLLLTYKPHVLALLHPGLERHMKDAALIFF